MATLLVHAYSSNENLIISHAIIPVNHSFRDKVWERKAVFDAAKRAAGKQELYSLQFWDYSPTFMEDVTDANAPVPDYDNDIILLAHDLDPKTYMDTDKTLRVRAVCMIVTAYGIRFEGSEKYTGSVVSTEELSYHDVDVYCEEPVPHPTA